MPPPYVQKMGLESLYCTAPFTPDSVRAWESNLDPFCPYKKEIVHEASMTSPSSGTKGRSWQGSSVLTMIFVFTLIHQSAEFLMVHVSTSKCSVLSP